jgi:hypothetical protein
VDRISGNTLLSAIRRSAVSGFGSENSHAQNNMETLQREFSGHITKNLGLTFEDLQLSARSYTRSHSRTWRGIELGRGCHRRWEAITAEAASNQNRAIGEQGGRMHLPTRGHAAR